MDELSQLDKFLSVTDEFTKGGGLLGIGLCCSKVHNDVDPAFAVLSDYLDESVGHPKVRFHAALSFKSRCCFLVCVWVFSLSLSLHLLFPWCQMVRIGALLGLGLAYAGSQREDVQALLSPFASDTSATADMEVVSIAALALGLVYCGTLCLCCTSPGSR